MFIGRTDAKAETLVLWPPDEKSWLIGKDSDAGKDWRQEEKEMTEDEIGWMASSTRWTWVWVDSRSWWQTGRPGMLRFMGWKRVGHDWVTELNWTELKAITDKETEVMPIRQEIKMLSHLYGLDRGLALCSDTIMEWFHVYLAPFQPQGGLVQCHSFVKMFKRRAPRTSCGCQASPWPSGAMLLPLLFPLFSKLTVYCLFAFLQMCPFVPLGNELHLLNLLYNTCIALGT